MENNQNAQKKPGKIKSVIDEFKQFISKGNVLDLAVGVIIGGAFTTIVTSLVEDIIMPVVGTLLAGVNFNDLGVRIPWGNRPFINVGNFLQAVIVFLLTAICVFGIVKIIGIFYKREKKVAKPTKDQELLAEIRDLLKAQNGGQAAEPAETVSEVRTEDDVK